MSKVSFLVNTFDIHMLCMYPCCLLFLHNHLDNYFILKIYNSFELNKNLTKINTLYLNPLISYRLLQTTIVYNYKKLRFYKYFIKRIMSLTHQVYYLIWWSHNFQSTIIWNHLVYNIILIHFLN